MPTHSLSKFLEETNYIDFSHEAIQSHAEQLFSSANSREEILRISYEYVRDEIPHSFDHVPAYITAKASDVLMRKTGICHAKSNLLAALLRSQNIPTGFRFQRITFADDDSQGYCVHAFNAVYIHDRWIQCDARGNKEGIQAELSFDDPKLAFPLRKHYDEYFFPGIYARPLQNVMQMLVRASSVQEVSEQIPDSMDEHPDIESF